jgi:hypothetical protein
MFGEGIQQLDFGNCIEEDNRIYVPKAKKRWSGFGRDPEMKLCHQSVVHLDESLGQSWYVG